MSRMEALAGLRRVLPSTGECLQLLRRLGFADDASMADPGIVLAGFDAVLQSTRRMAVVHLDDEYMVVNKPAGLLVNNGLEGQMDVDRLTAAYWREAGAGPVPFRNCHQIDFATSGILVLARGRAAAGRMGRLFEAREISKSYIAILHGHLPQAEGSSGTAEPAIRVTFPIGDDVDSGGARMRCLQTEEELAEWAAREVQRRADIAGDKRRVRELVRSGAAVAPEELLRAPQGAYTARPAETHIFPLLRTALPCGSPATVALLKPVTGRRHQLRVHCLALGHPILGDRTYESEAHTAVDSVGRMWLHAWDIRGTLRYKPRDRVDGVSEKHFHWITRVPWDAEEPLEEI